MMALRQELAAGWGPVAAAQVLWRERRTCGRVQIRATRKRCAAGGLGAVTARRLVSYCPSRHGPSSHPPRGQGTSVVVGFQPSSMTSKSSAVRLPKAGFRMSLSQRPSMVPEMYMSVPLSARMMP